MENISTVNDGRGDDGRIRGLQFAFFLERFASDVAGFLGYANRGVYGLNV